MFYFKFNEIIQTKLDRDEEGVHTGIKLTDFK